MVAALVGILGPRNVDLAEDVVQETLCHALALWKFRGVTQNPAAWLWTAARNRALDALRTEKRRARLAPDAAELLAGEAPSGDEELRMMFACCDPRLAPEVQVTITLKLLCGFGTNEIAQAFLTSTAAAEKRLARGKAALRRAGSLAAVEADAQLAKRLDAVLEALYLLFNEGYHGAHPELVVRRELCEEALRLARLLTTHRATATGRTFALVALLCFGLARLAARVDADGALVPLEEQDRSSWDRSLVQEGIAWLHKAAEIGDDPTALHLEAAIAAEHTLAPSLAATHFGRICALYDALYALRASPVVALGRAIALGQLHGAERGLAELRALADRERLARYPFYAAALGEFERRAGRLDEAAQQFRRASRLSRSPAERRYFERKLATCAREGSSNAARYDAAR
jgi:RNA polymerase sigma-70 factor (ECF subfamily)